MVQINPHQDVIMSSSCLQTTASSHPPPHPPPPSCHDPFLYLHRSNIICLVIEFDYSKVYDTPSCCVLWKHFPVCLKSNFVNGRVQVKIQPRLILVINMKRYLQSQIARTCPRLTTGYPEMDMQNDKSYVCWLGSIQVYNINRRLWQKRNSIENDYFFSI